MSDIGVKTMMSSPTLFGMYIDELETYLDEINKDFPCLFAILLYTNDVVLLSKFGVGLQRLLNKLYEFFTSSSIEVTFSKTKIMIFGYNKRKSNQEAIYLDKDPIGIYIPWD